jgi:LysM repeat protein
MYLIFLSYVPLPITPSKIQTKITNQNRSINLINEGEVNLLKSPGLSEISFDAMIPQVKYPFAYYSLDFLTVPFFLAHFQKLKEDKKPFQFICVRISPAGKLLFSTNIKVGLEDYTILEDASNGQDLIVSIKLKEYKSFGTKIFDYNPNTNTATIKVLRSTETAPSLKNYTVKADETLWNIAKKYLGDGSKYADLLKLNKNITNPNSLTEGQKLIFPS